MKIYHYHDYLLNKHIGIPPPTFSEMAKRMGVSRGTIRFYYCGLYQHYGVHNRLELFNALGWIQTNENVPNLRQSYQAVIKVLAKHPDINDSELAEKLGIKLFTVRGYLSEIYRLCGVGTRLELIDKLGWYKPKPIKLEVA